MDYKSLGKNIQTYRRKAELTQARLAEIVRYSDSYIGQIENARTIPSLEAVVRIAKALSVTVDRLLINDIANPEQVYFAEMCEKIKNYSIPMRDGICQMFSKMLDDILNNLDTFYDYGIGR